MSRDERVGFVLVHPEQAGNVGSVARVLANLGFSDLRLVEPRCDDWREARKLAVHAAPLLERARRYETLAEALADAHWVVATSCRGRTNPERKPPLGPEEFAERLRRLPAGHRLALVFGPESTGLTNRQLGQCQDILCLPTSGDYPSLNLAQAVAICAWEVRRVAPLAAVRSPRAPRASAGEVAGLIEHMRRTLGHIGYLNPQNPELVLEQLRAFILRAEPDGREIDMLRGIFHKMDVWMARHGGPPNPNQARRQKPQ